MLSRFGLLSGFKDTGNNISGAMGEFVDSLGTLLKDAIGDATRLEVSTYTSDNMSGVTYEKGKFVGPADLRAQTVIELDGDTSVCIPMKAGEIDDELWAIHLEIVKQAQASRNELMQIAVSAATSVLTLGKA